MVFLLSVEPRLALEPIQPPIQWIPGVLTPVVNWSWHEADRSPLSSARLRMVKLYYHSQKCLQSIVHNYIVAYKTVAMQRSGEITCVAW
jgi:hypothetical protein